MKLVLLVALVLAACSSGGGGSVRGSLTPTAGSAPAFTSKLRIVPGLAEPLVTTKATTEAEDRDLDQATSGRDGAEAPLLAFVAGHPDSGWNAAIHTNLGLTYYRQGFFSKAIAVYEAAWKEGREATDFRAKTLVDRAVAELAKMHARVGHLRELDALVAEIGDRPIQGGASELITGAKEGAWTMRHNPGISYLCGPKALKNVLETLGATPAAIALVEAARSGEHGFSLAQLGKLADRAGLAHRLVHRDPGQPIPVPSVINWRVSHYAAIVGKTGNDRYKVMDPTFGGDLEISEAAIDEEGSGFFLVPAQAGQGDRDDLRLAWREATPGEARETYGMGFPSSYVLGAVTGADFRSGVFGAAEDALWNPSQTVECTTCGSISGGMPVPDAHAMEVSLNLNDTPVGYAPPVGPPAYIRLAYNQREAVEPYGPPSNPVSFNVGPQWTLNVLSYVLDDPESPGAGVSRYVPGGGAVSGYTDYSYSTGAFDPEKQTGATLARTPATGMATSYTLTGTDGSRLVYAQNDGSTSASTYRRLFLTSIVDPQGNALTLNYDTTLPAPDAGADGGPSGFGSAAVFPRLSSITDPTGTTTTTFTYGLNTTPLLVTQITDTFGRSASITYDTNGRLSSIQDVMGLTSTVTYDDGNTPPRPTFIKQLTTPYGNTTFNYGETNSGSAVVTRWLETTDPLGQTERLEFMEQAPGIPAADETGVSLPLPSGMPLGFGTSYMIYRNSFFWNKHIYKTYGTGAGKDYTKAELVHWLHTNNGLYVAPTIESIRHPLEHRTWYQYTPGQTSSIDEGPPSTYLGAPTTTARVLDDGSTQLTTTTRNQLGKPLLVTDALGRQTRLAYGANNTDLLLVQQKLSSAGFGVLGAYTYNAQHEPLTYTDASGETTRYSYNNPAGQLLTVTDALGHLRTVGYDGSGRVSKLIDANNQPVLTLSYDSANRVATRTDSVGYTLSYGYDNFDRVTQVAYPDKTTEKYVYANLDLASVTDRLGQTTTYDYDAERRLTKVTDPAGNATQYAYYEDGTLESITDPNGNVTTWGVDIQGRPVKKTYADGTTETYAYESATSRLHSKTDALGQVTTYAYGTDGSLTGVSYSGPGAASSTPAVSFAYDTELPRITSMTDGIGTTSYVYYPIAVEPAVDGGADVDGGAATLPPIPAAPGAGRLQAVLSPVAGAPAGTVDTVSYSYDALGRVGSRGVNGVAQTVAFDPLGRPSAVTNALDAFAYGYSDETPRITSVASANGPSVALSYWDAASHPEQNELLQQITYSAGGAIPEGGASGRILSRFGYAYYPNGNVETFTEAHATQAASAVDAGAPHDSGGATGMTLPWLRKGGRGSDASGNAWTRARLASQGNAGVLIFAAGLLLGAIAWLRAGKGRLASALTPVALGLVFAACGGGNGAGGHTTGADAGGDSGASGDGGAGLETQVTAYKYDAASRLISATLGTNGMPPAASAVPQFAYKYDAASNPTSIAANRATQSPTYTSTNEIGGGSYDLNGSPTSLQGATYAWDAANRLISATVGGVENDFTYDGSSRLVRIVEKQGASTTSDKAYTWAGTTRVLEHDNAASGSPISKRYFAQGLVDGGHAYYYGADRLGSVRQLVDPEGTIRAQYSYDPYGNRTRLSGDVEGDVGFAGYFNHGSSGLALALYRAYKPQNARWLNRDPIGEAGGINMYGYAIGDPADRTDIFGLESINFSDIAGLDPDDPDNVYNNDNYYTVGGHGADGDPTHLYPLVNSSGYDVNQIGQTILNWPQNQWDRKKPIQLVMCHAGQGGQDSFAARLAQYLAQATQQPVTVVASADLVRVDNPYGNGTRLERWYGRLVGGTVDPGPGGWQQFTAVPDSR